jgi:hypothetical protein
MNDTPVIHMLSWTHTTSLPKAALVVSPSQGGETMIVLGVILLIVGYLLPIPILATIGWLLLVIGLVLWALSAFGHPVLGRNRWY